MLYGDFPLAMFILYKHILSLTLNIYIFKKLRMVYAVLLMGTKNVPTRILDTAFFVGTFCPHNVGFTCSVHNGHYKQQLKSYHKTIFFY